MKKKWLMALSVSLYVALAVPVVVYFSENALQQAGSEWVELFDNRWYVVVLLIGIVLLIVNIFAPDRMAGRDIYQNIKTIFFFKLGLLPYLLGSFAFIRLYSSEAYLYRPLWFDLLFAPLHPFWLVLLFSPLSYYAVLLATSAHAIWNITVVAKSGRLDKKRFAGHVLMQLVFFLDIIGCLILMKKEEKWKAACVAKDTREQP